MGLELVGGRIHGQGQGAESPGHGEGDGDRDGDRIGGVGSSSLIAHLSDAEKSIAESRQRLQALADQVAELRRRLTENGSVESPPHVGTPPA